MSLPHAPVGFDYQSAIRDLNTRMSYREIAEFCGYEDHTGILKVLKGRIPAHPQGEALWVLYKQTFNRRPPVTAAQAAGRFGANSHEQVLLSTA